MTITNEERNELVRLYTEENVSLRKQLDETYEAMIYAQNELADLRAYKERTEAGLLRMCSKVSEEDFSNYGLVVDQSASRTWRVRDMVRCDMDVNRLWRDPPQAEVQP